jgi:hypothetical protein
MPYNDRLYQLLNDLDDSELEDLWVHGLQCKPDDAEFRALSHELKVDRISTEWRPCTATCRASCAGAPSRSAGSAC